MLLNTASLTLAVAPRLHSLQLLLANYICLWSTHIVQNIVTIQRSCVT